MKNLFLISVLLLNVVNGYSQIRVEFDKKVDFKTYKTFKFEPEKVIRRVKGQDNNSTFLDNYISESVTKNLISKGPTDNQPDLVITYLAGAREKEQVQNYMSNIGYYPYAGFYGYGMGGWWGPGWNNFWVNKYEEGTLIVDVYDANNAELVWRAYTVSRIDKFDEKKFVEKQVAKAFKKFPPKG